MTCVTDFDQKLLAFKNTVRYLSQFISEMKMSFRYNAYVSEV